MKRLEITKYQLYKDDENYYGFDLKREEDKTLSIFYGRNLDLYFSLENYGSDPTFLIGKDNYQIYSLFDELYERIIDANIYGTLTEEEINDIVFFSKLNGEDDHQNLANEITRRKQYQEDLKTRSCYKKLVQNNEILWKSDEYFEEITPFVRIKKLENAYLLEFNKPVVSKKYENEIDLMFRNPYTITIRFRNSGSRYDPFNIIFMQLYQKLCSLDKNLDQIHIEEYLISQKISEGIPLSRILKKE